MTAKKSKTGPDKRRKYDDAFKAEALRLASESRSTQAVAQQLGISPKLLYLWQQAPGDLARPLLAYNRGLEPA